MPTSIVPGLDLRSSAALPLDEPESCDESQPEQEQTADKGDQYLPQLFMNVSIRHEAPALLCSDWGCPS